MNQLALTMMVKNEAEHISKTFESIKDYVNIYIILDTGSEDETVSVAQEWAKNNDKEIHVKETTFVNFEYSRNELLEFAETIKGVNWLLLADASDEFRGDFGEIVSLIDKNTHNGISIEQVWFTGTTEIKYKNIRVIKNNEGWRYKGVVHECLDIKSPVLSECPNGFYIYQDRTKDGNKSYSRFSKDYEMLKKGIDDDPDNARYFFYMGQTCMSIDKHAEAIVFFTKYLEFENNFFLEEIFHAQKNIGICHLKIGCKKLALESFLKSYNTLQRVEPLMYITNYYIEKKMWKIAHFYCNKALQLEYPQNSILFVEDRDYSYTRWFMMGIIAYYVSDFECGKTSIQKALCYKYINEDEIALNNKNLEFYQVKE